MTVETVHFVSYLSTPGTVQTTLHDGPLRGVVVSVQDSLPPLIAINGKRNGDHRVWITHFYRRTLAGYSHVRTSVSNVQSMC